MVEDRSPFCPSCGGPQIHFSVRQPSSEAVVVGAGVSGPSASSSSFSSSTFSPSSYVRAEAETPIARRSGSFDRPAAVRSALNAGAIAGTLSLIPPVLILAPPLAGFLAVRLYRRRSSTQGLSKGDGFKLGALAGLFGSAIFGVLRAAQIVASGEGGQLIEKVRQTVASNPDPQVRQILEYFTSPHGLVVLMIFGFVVTCVAFVLFSGLGGAISAGLLRRKGPLA